MFITKQDLFNAIQDLDKTSNIFKILYAEHPITVKEIEEIIAQFDLGVFEIPSAKLFDAGFGKNLIKLELDVLDSIKCQILANQLESHLASYVLQNCSYKIKDADLILVQAKKIKRENKYFLLTDIKGFFSSIPHSILFQTLERLDLEPVLLKLCNEYLKTLMKLDSNFFANAVGIPVGLKLSYVFSNAMLLELDKMIVDTLGETKYVRFIDDIFIGTNEKDLIDKILKLIINDLRKLKLELNSAKTKVGINTEQVRYLRFLF